MRLKDQLLSLTCWYLIGQRVIDARASSAKASVVLPEEISKGLDNIYDNILHLSKLVDQFESERRNLAALVDIGQVVNSSLDSTTVLND
jgi:pyocin large subunit-like protein